MLSTKESFNKSSLKFKSLKLLLFGSFGFCEFFLFWTSEFGGYHGIPINHINIASSSIVPVL